MREKMMQCVWAWVMCEMHASHAQCVRVESLGFWDCLKPYPSYIIHYWALLVSTILDFEISFKARTLIVRCSTPSVDIPTHTPTQHTHAFTHPPPNTPTHLQSSTQPVDPHNSFLLPITSSLPPSLPPSFPPSLPPSLIPPKLPPSLTRQH